MQVTGKQGEYVAIEFSSADASTAAAVTLKDANNATRTLASNERLLIDSLSCKSVADNDDPSTDISVTVFVDNDVDGNVDANERILVYSVAGVYDGGAEGFSCNRAITPKVKASGSGQVDVNGVGRIIKDGCILGKTRAGFESSLVPGQ